MRIRVVPIARQLVNPWSLAFLPDGSLLVTEKEGRLRIIRNGELWRRYQHGAAGRPAY